jgi:predicted ribosome quality control (RQC) complex YloA/Tae2 family protein
VIVASVIDSALGLAPRLARLSRTDDSRVFDVLTIAAIADELTDAVLDGRIQRIGHLDARTLGAEIYAGGRRRYLIASADADRPRIYLTETEPSFDSQLVTPLFLLLRKYVRGGYLVGVEQPPLERVLRLSIAKRLRPHNGPQTERETPFERADTERDDAEEADAEGLVDAVFVHLMVEIMGRHSNLILVDDHGRIMESVKRVTTAMSRVRPIQPRLEYTDPPPVDRPDPRRITSADATAIFATEQSDAKLAQVLTRRLRAVSPQMAREIAFRVTGDAGVTVSALGPDEWNAVARETRNLFEPLLTSAWGPRVYRDEEGTVVAFSPVPMGHLAAVRREDAVPTISRAAELAEGGDETAPARHVQRRARLLQIVRATRSRVAHRLTSLQAESARAAEADRYREWGDLIYAHLWTIAPGQRELVVDAVSIPLDSALSAKENAQAFFERYRKAQSAGAHLPELIAKTEQEVAYLDQLETLIAQAEQFVDLETLAAEWDAYQRASGRAEGARPPKRSTSPRRPRPLYDDAGNAIYIGRSGAENDAVTFDVAGADDTWLHARGVPGSHVIVRWRNPAVPEDEETLRRAASLAAYYSAARTSGTVEVDATRRRYVRKIKGTGPGMVTYRNERTIAVRPLSEAELGLSAKNST